MTVVIESRRDLTLANTRRVAWEGEGVEIGQAALQRMRKARARFLRLIEDPDVVIYGVTSGYGQNAKVRLSPAERKLHAKRPPIAASAAFGDPLPERVARAIVFARLANFVEGHAAITPELAVAVAAMLDGHPLPKVPARGQGGAGEIVSLSPLFSDLAASVELEEKDALSLVNGSPSASGLVADAALAAASRLNLAAEVLALAAEGFNAPLTHFDAKLDEYWNNPHDVWALQRLRSLIGNGHGGARRPYQAPVSFRILPRILGQAHLALTMAEAVAEESLAAVTDNPVLLPPDDRHPNGQAISTGGYHNAQAPMAMDALTATSVNLIVIAERMSAKLLDSGVSLLPPQLGGEEDRPYLGCLPMAITGYEEEARMLAQATLLPGSESGGFGQNDIASPVFLAWKKQDRAGELLDASLASLAPIALRALEVTDRPAPPALQGLVETIRQAEKEAGSDAAPGSVAERLAVGLGARVYR